MTLTSLLSQLRAWWGERTQYRLPYSDWWRDYDH